MRYYIIFLAFLLTTTATAQTTGWKQLPGPYRGLILDTKFGNGNTAFSLTFDNRTLFFRDENNTWFSRPGPPISPNVTSYGAKVGLSIDKKNNVYCFVTSPNGTHFPDSQLGIYRYLDKGKSWSKSLSGISINDIICSNSGNLYAFYGDLSSSITKIYRSTNSGISWDSLTSISLGSFDFAVDNDDNCYFTIYDNGSGVVRFDSKTGLYKALIFQSDKNNFKSPPLITIVKDEVFVRTRDKGYIIHSDGSWELRSYIAPYFQSYTRPNKLLFSDSYGTIYTHAIIDSGNEATSLFYSTDIGKTWNMLISPPLYLDNRNVSYTVDSIGKLYNYGIYEDIGIFSSTNKGRDWNQVGIANSRVTLLQNGPSNLIYAKEDAYTIADYTFSSKNVSTIDYGLSWVDISSLFPKFAPLGYFTLTPDSGYLYMCTYFTPNKIFYAPYSNPLNFEDQASILGTVIQTSIWKKKLFALTDIGIIFTTDNGITWEALTTPETQTKLNTFNISPNGTFYIGFSPALYKSIDEGQNWSKVITPLKNTSISTINFFENTSTIVIGTLGSGVWRSNDNGVTWEQWAPGGFDTVNAIEIIGDKCIAATNKGLISCKQNSDQWQMDLFTTEQIPILQLLKTKAGHLYASTDGYGIWTNDLLLNDVHSPRTNSEIPLSVTQNPNTSSIKISFSLETYQHASLMLYDILGHKIATIANADLEDGGHRIEYNTSGLGNGIYNVVLKTSGGISSEKLLISR